MAVTCFRDLHKFSPYTGYEPLPAKCYGWGSEDENFARMIDTYQPATIIEVGSWLGASAIHMARLAPMTEILCVDTWLGSYEWYTGHVDPERYDSLGLFHGYPTVYYQFLSNIMRAGLQAQITPLALPSRAAAEVLTHFHLKTDLVYLDAGHSYDDVNEDLINYWPLANKALFGDDWSFSPFPGVRKAVEDFAMCHPCVLYERGRQWVLEKKNA